MLLLQLKCYWQTSSPLPPPIFIPRSLSTSTQALPKLSLLCLSCWVISQICSAWKYTSPLPTAEPELCALLHCSLKQTDFTLACYNSSFACPSSVLKRGKVKVLQSRTTRALVYLPTSSRKHEGILAISQSAVKLHHSLQTRCDQHILCTVLSLVYLRPTSLTECKFGSSSKSET